jgi:hypothetical protein
MRPGIHNEAGVSMQQGWDSMSPSPSVGFAPSSCVLRYAGPSGSASPRNRTRARDNLIVTSPQSRPMCSPNFDRGTVMILSATHRLDSRIRVTSSAHIAVGSTGAVASRSRLVPLVDPGIDEGLVVGDPDLDRSRTLLPESLAVSADTPPPSATVTAPRGSRPATRWRSRSCIRDFRHSRQIPMPV